jgi:hypothetical protein
MLNTNGTSVLGGKLMSLIARPCAFAIAALASVAALPAARGQNFVLQAVDFVPETATTHYDTFSISFTKPLSHLELAVISSGDPDRGELHLPGSQILLPLAGAAVLEQVNTDAELSIKVDFPTPLPPGEYPAAKVVFGYSGGEYFHFTWGYASGLFADGNEFEVEIFAGAFPEPTAGTLALAAVAAATCMRQRRGHR